MRVTAWMCDRCGRMMPGDEVPDGWLKIQIDSAVNGTKKLEMELFCSRSCAGLWFKPSKNTKVEHEPTVVVSDLSCEECDWTPKTNAQMPVHALNLHRRRKHGDLKGATYTGGPRRKNNGTR